MFIHLYHQTKFNTKQVKIMGTYRKLIGFATEYYTLWNEATIEHYRTNEKGEHFHAGTTIKYTYIQNLSKDEDTALEKFAKRFKVNIEDIEVDESLRGIPSRSFEKYIARAIPADEFPFGRFQYCKIADCDDVFQLKRVYQGEGAIGGNRESKSTPARRRVLARRKLVQLGELIRFDHMADLWDNDKGEWLKEAVPTKYILKWEYERILKVQASAWAHNTGDKITTELRWIKSTGYESAYGYVSIVTYASRDGIEYIYQGTTPPNIPKDDEFYKVQGTIKNTEYKEIKQNTIQRVKLLERVFSINEMEEWLIQNSDLGEGISNFSDEQIRIIFKGYYSKLQVA